MQGLITETPPLDVFEHMAFDELRAQSGDGVFHIRFFNWKGDGATFGYAQFYDEVEKCLPPWAGTSNITRRPTGGGVVPHLHDLTFSCIFPSEGAISPDTMYDRIHRAIHAGLIERGIDCALAGKPDKTKYMPSLNGLAAVCFKNPVSLDLVDSTGEKILGGAIRRFDNTVMYQGSLQLKQARQKAAELRLIIIRQLAASWDIKWTTAAADNSLLENAKRLAVEKYRTSDWIKKF